MTAPMWLMFAGVWVSVAFDGASHTTRFYRWLTACICVLGAIAASAA